MKEVDVNMKIKPEIVLLEKGDEISVSVQVMSHTEHFGGKIAKFKCWGNLEVTLDDGTEVTFKRPKEPEPEKKSISVSVEKRRKPKTA